MKLLSKWLPLLGFSGSANYWQERYRLGGDSGAGSGGAPAAYKSGVLNRFVRENDVKSLIEFGCGDGRQLGSAKYPNYLGFDISADAIARCRASFSGDESKRFEHVDNYSGETAEVALSLDVLFHLVEDEVYHSYLDRLFAAASRYVVIYSTSTENGGGTLRHVRHRPIEQDVKIRYPGFWRDTEFEASIPAPVEHGRGGWTRFFIYRCPSQGVNSTRDRRPVPGR